ncbi:hypothetical protein BG28_06615 [Nesterenkonia sp. AN1]|uniref:hypothetical protein n=1 Tax=Nesterenkonia sp. AN1 TaxID=652017 RepID=UPI000449A63A|nr:hypothetical protein [Nesterenkonia sp. AN1]EXF24271.1 hypothetical protein BG28_06615 [Nesterenkonia sp. AN1]
MTSTPTGADVAAFLGLSDDPTVVALAGEHLPIIKAMARAYTRGAGFIGHDVSEDIAAVITTATARLVANPEQLHYAAGSARISGAFNGWTLPETFVLNRYRKRAA